MHTIFIIMDKTVRGGRLQNYATSGDELSLSFAAFTTVEDWGRPVLRSAYWRCYLPTTEGAAVRSDREVWPLQVGKVMVIPPESPVRGEAEGAFSLYYAHFESSIRIERPQPWVGTADSSIRSDLDRAYKRRNEALFRMATLRLAASVFALLPPNRLYPSSTDGRLRQALALMAAKPAPRLTNQELARALSCSESSLLRLFRSGLNSTPAKEYTRIRLHRAADLLQGTEMSLERIADACGFCDRNHLTRVFTRYWEIPPARYRNSVTSV